MLTSSRGKRSVEGVVSGNGVKEGGSGIVAWSMPLLASACAGFAMGAALLLMERRKWARETAALRSELRQVEDSRVMERNGRINAQKRLASMSTLAAAHASGTHRDQGPTLYPHRPIGYLQGSFKLCRDTPRQGLLAPQVRARVKLENWVARESIEGLDGFSHVWVVFEFHRMSDGGRRAAVELGGASGGGGGGGRKPRGKIRVPAMKGGKVGVFASRSPHRPNAIGLTLAQVELVDVRKGLVWLKGVDCIDGTPILDLKPYSPSADLPHQLLTTTTTTTSTSLPTPSLPTTTSTTPSPTTPSLPTPSTPTLSSHLPPGVRVPWWVTPAASTAVRQRVEWSAGAEGDLEALGGSRLYPDAATLQEAVTQVLAVDLRNEFQRGGKKLKLRPNKEEQLWFDGVIFTHARKKRKSRRRGGEGGGEGGREGGEGREKEAHGGGGEKEVEVEVEEEEEVEVVLRVEKENAAKPAEEDKGVDAEEVRGGGGGGGGGGGVGRGGGGGGGEGEEEGVGGEMPPPTLPPPHPTTSPASSLSLSAELASRRHPPAHTPSTDDASSAPPPDSPSAWATGSWELIAAPFTSEDKE